MNALPSSLLPRLEQQDDVKIVTLLEREERRDGGDALARQLESHTEGPGKYHLLLDFTHVEWITSAELGTLILLHKKLASQGGRLTLFNLRPEIYEVFSITRLDTVLTICREG